MQSLKEWATYTTGFIVRWLSCGINVCERFVSCCCCLRFVVLENKFTYAIGLSERARVCVGTAQRIRIMHMWNIHIMWKSSQKMHWKKCTTWYITNHEQDVEKTTHTKQKNEMQGDAQKRRYTHTEAKAKRAKDWWGKGARGARSSTLKMKADK